MWQHILLYEQKGAQVWDRAWPCCYDEEIKTVSWIYNEFVNGGKSEKEIADELNRRGVKTDLDRDWTRPVVREILSNEKYIGNNVFNRMSFKLKERHVKNPESEWVRKVGAFEGIVDPVLFGMAKGKIGRASCRERVSSPVLIFGFAVAL